jgi:hypothetical protein
MERKRESSSLLVNIAVFVCFLPLCCYSNFLKVAISNEEVPSLAPGVRNFCLAFYRSSWC